MSNEDYDGINKMLTVCKGLLWVTGDQVAQPKLGMATGLIRTVRWERDLDETNLITLTIPDPQPKVDDLVKSVVGLIKEQFSGAVPVAKFHGEFVLESGRLLTSRLHNAAAADDFLSTKFSKPKPVMMPLKDAGRPLKLSTAAPGRLDRLEWVSDLVYQRSLTTTEVEIEIKAAGLNFRDIMIAMGEHMAYAMGCEASGRLHCIAPYYCLYADGPRCHFSNRAGRVRCEGG
jgi:hypothetical protein